MPLCCSLGGTVQVCLRSFSVEIGAVAMFRTLDVESIFVGEIMGLREVKRLCGSFFCQHRSRNELGKSGL